MWRRRGLLGGIPDRRFGDGPVLSLSVVPLSVRCASQAFRLYLNGSLHPVAGPGVMICGECVHSAARSSGPTKVFPWSPPATESSAP
jgi:hypothetical protein